MINLKCIYYIYKKEDLLPICKSKHFKTPENNSCVICSKYTPSPKSNQNKKKFLNNQKVLGLSKDRWILEGSLNLEQLTDMG